MRAGHLRASQSYDVEAGAMAHWRSAGAHASQSKSLRERNPSCPTPRLGDGDLPPSRVQPLSNSIVLTCDILIAMYHMILMRR